jgi:hypothetical protein
MKYYLCGIAFQSELGETDEIGIYSSLEELKSKHECWESCGIVEIESDGKPEKYTSHVWVVPQDLKFNSKRDYLDPGTEEDLEPKK